MKFEELKSPNPDVMISAYQHVDNGGHTVTVDRYHGVTIETGFFGYSHTTVLLSTVDIDGLIQVLQTAKQRIEEDEVARRLKGEY